MRAIAAGVATLLVAVGLTVGAFLSPAVAGEFISLSATGPGTIVSGEQVSITLQAQASSVTDHYNLAFRYELPVGVSYAPGSSATNGPTDDPSIITITDTPAAPGVPAVTHQVLVWSNVADLPAGISAPLSFAVVPDPALYPVGSTVPGAAAVYAQSDPRLLVKFNATTGAASNFTASAVATPVATKVAAIEVTKSEPSPEHELMRGVQHQATVYTITTRNTAIAATESVVLVDYLPAGLEFLGCGATDNSPQATEEYPGSGRLDQTAAVTTDCLAPVSVETVTDRPDFLGQVFTKVTWNLGTLAAGATATLNYAAGIPLHANEAWPVGTAPDSTAALQGANLGNNTGASTRQEDAADAGQALTNTATASGHYLGAVATAADRATTSTDSVTVRAMDLSIVKTGTSGFGAGQLANFSLLLRAGEYTDDSAMSIVDVIPNGLCPILPASVVFTRSAGCANGGVTGATVDSTVANADGTFTVTMTPTPTALAHDSSLTISYDAYMGASYQGATSTGTGTGVPTAAGDGFLNVVSITGTTAGRTTGEGAKAVTDDSEAGLESSGPVIGKKVLPRPTGGSTADCEAGAGNYTDTDTPTYQLGDTVCFELSVVFSDSSKTRNARITDFVPVGTTFAGYQVAAGGTGTPKVTVTPVPGTEAADPADTSALPAAWALGDPEGGSDRFVPQGAALTLYVSATVTGQPAGAEVDITANLMKYRQNSTDGTVLALRDQVDFGIAPAPVLTLEKSVALVDTVAPAAPNDSVAVREGDLVTFSVKITNTHSDATNNNNVPVADVAVWDALPADYTCAGWTVASISDSGTCVNPGEPGYPTDVASDTRSVIVWTVPGPLADGASARVSYSITVPQSLSVASKFTNTASVVAFTSPNTSGGATTFFPKGSLDQSHKDDGNASPANDTAEVHLPDAVVAKTGVTDIALDNNDQNSQVVAGETVDYTYSVTIPAGTTVFDGLLSDPTVTGLTKPAAGATVSSVPAGGSFNAATGTLTFPSTYDNDTALDQTFTVTIPGVLVGVGLSSGTLTNTASFASNATPSGTAVAPRTATKTVTVTAPAPTLAKSVDKPTARGGEVVTFTLTAGNTAGRPAAFDSVITDCLPTGLSFATGPGFLTSPAGTVTAEAAGTGANGCAIGTTKLTWTLPASGALLNPAVTTVTFGAVVDPDSAGLVKYTNTAFVTGSTLDNDPGQNVTPVNDSATELVVTATSSAVVTVEGAVTVKTVQPAAATIGGKIDYSISVALPLNVQFYDAAIVDTLPAGIRPDSATVTCLTAQGVSCDSVLPGAGAPLKTVDNKIGWLLGDVPRSSENRTITVTFSATVLAGTAGDILKNGAFLGWYRANGNDPKAADATFDEKAVSPTADVTVLEPNLTISKAVSDTTPEPGQVITYTVTTRNANSPTTSDAFDVTVVDAIPAGLDLASIANISGGGTLSGGEITWTVPTIAKGGSNVQTFQAKLAASSTLDGTAIVNQVAVPRYRSLSALPPSPDAREYTANPPTANASVTPAFPNITVAKAVTNGSTAYLNTDFGWTLTLRNTGTGAAKTVTPTDVLPRNWVYTAGTGTVKVGSAASVALADPMLNTTGGVQTLVWAPLTAVTPGAVIVIRFSAQPTTAAATTPGPGATVRHRNTLTATATDATDASGRSGPTAYASGTATADAFLQSADVRIAKAAGDPLVAGTTTPRAWTLTVRNSGPDTAVGNVGGRNFVVTDLPAQPLPTGITVAAASGTGWSCTTPDLTTGAFDCARSNANETLANGAAWPVINVAVAVASTVADATTVTNSASVSARTYDPAPANNTSEATIPVTTSADLAVTKTAQGAFAAGQQASWHLDVVNVGPSNSAGPITVTDVLPGNISDVVASGPDTTCAVTGVSVTCTLDGDLALNATARIVVTALVDSGFTGSLTNTATVSGTTADPVPGNNESETITPVDTTTTLGITKSLVEPALVPGTTATYRFVVTNTGFADARNVAIADALPKDLTYAGPGAAGPGMWACSETSAAPSTIGCALTGTLIAGGTETIDVRVNVPSSLTGDVLNKATVTSANTPPATGTTDTSLTGVSDLGITKSHPTGEVLAGTSVDYTLTVANFGPSDAPVGTVVVDHVPVGLVPVSARGSGWNCAAPVGQDLTCTSTGILAAGATAGLITVLVSIPADVGAATFTNVATVVGVLPEPTADRNPNRAEDPTVVTTFAAVTIVKTIAPSATEVVAGTSIGYTLTVTNAGPSNADALTVADVLPSGFTAIDISGAGWNCTLATVSCARATMGVTASVITVTARVPSAVLDGTVATNSATVGWTDSRPTRHTDTDTVPVTVVALGDLELTKSTPSGNAMAGSDIDFDFVLVNDGPSNAVGAITIVDTLPVGLRLKSNTLGWSCVAAVVLDTDAQPVTCTLGDGTVGIAEGGTATALTITTISDPALGAVTLTNTATTSTPSRETTLANNAGAAAVTFGQSADLSVQKSHTGSGRIGEGTAFRMVVTNDGPSTATGISVVDTLPRGLSYLDAAGSDPLWTCVASATDPTAGTTPVTCSLATDLGPQQTAPELVVNASVGALAYPSVTNVAQVAGVTPDPDGDNNTASDTLLVDPLVSLGVTKTHLGEAQVGRQLDYLVTVTNSGPTKDPGTFTIVDELPASLRYVRSTGENVVCVPAGQTVTCLFEGPLAVGERRTVTLTVNVLQAAFPQVVNTVTVQSASVDTAQAPITASDTAKVLAAPMIFGLARTGVEATMLFIAVTMAVLALLLGLGLLWRDRRRHQLRSVR